MKTFPQEVVEQINKAFDQDQALRNSNVPSVTANSYAVMKELDAKSTELMKNIVKKYGLPTIFNVGEETSRNAWLLVQHSTDTEFQKDYLKLMKEHSEDVDIKYIAYLEDRILINEGRPQIYGTQVYFDEEIGSFRPKPLQNKEKVAELREKMHLEPLEVYLNSFMV